MDDLTRRTMLRHSGALLALLPAAAAGAVDVQGQQPPPPPPGAPPIAGPTVTAEAAKLLEAWDAWCDGMKSAAREIVLREQAPLDDQPTLADGFRYLARLAALGIDLMMPHTPPDVPMLRRSLGPHSKMGGDNPDTIYSSAPIDPAGTYRVSGTLGSAHEVVFDSVRRPGAYGTEPQYPTEVRGEDLVRHPDGHFELIVSRTPHEGNWLRIDERIGSIQIRQVFGDWQREDQGHMLIERLDRAPEQPPSLTPDMVVHGVHAAQQFTRTMGTTFAQRAENLRRTPNRMHLASDWERFQGTPGGVGVDGYFVLQPDEALLIEFTPGKTFFWEFQVGNFWYESFDYRVVCSSLNMKQVDVRTDGSVVLVLSAADPGVRNWLSTAGHREGILFARWIRVQATPPIPKTRVVKLEEWLRKLPPEVKTVTPAQRAADQRARRLAVDWRFG